MRKKLLAVFFAMLMGLAGVACEGEGEGEGREGGDGVEIEGDLEGEVGEGEGGEGGDD